MEIPNNRMVVFPAGSLVIEERFRIMREEDDYPLFPLRDFLTEAASLIRGVPEIGLVDTAAVAERDPDGAVLLLVRAAALLTVAADRLILAKEADDEAHA